MLNLIALMEFVESKTNSKLFTFDSKLVQIPDTSNPSNPKKLNEFHAYLRPTSPAWCIKNITDEKIRSLILTSATLPDFKFFAHRFGIHFEIQTVLDHVIDMKEQIFVSIIDKDKLGNTLTFPSQTKLMSDAVCNQLGDFVFKVSQVTPKGMLVFFTDFVFMKFMVEKWKKFGLFDKIDAIKTICMEVTV